MEHLSNRRFIHRDLAARNVLLTSGKSISSLVCKVADFGLSRAGRHSGNELAERSDNTHNEAFYYKSREGVAFPVRWTAPEAMEQLKFTHASDVWSFGIVMIEIIQDGTKPFPGIKGNRGVVRNTLAGNIHPLPVECETDPLMMDMFTLACRCFAHEEVTRPSFSDLAQRIEAVVPAIESWAESDESVLIHEEARLSAVASQYEYPRNVRETLIQFSRSSSQSSFI
jgi:serine/threonine protein kinase